MAEIAPTSSRLDWLGDAVTEEQEALRVATNQHSLAQYAVKSVKFYERAKQRMAGSKTGFANFNVACAVLGPIWAAWRRLAVLCTLIAVVDITMLVFIGRAVWLEPESGGGSVWPWLLAFIGARLVWGGVANSFFFYRYNKWRSNHALPVGTSLLAGLAGGGVVTFIAALMIYRFSVGEIPNFIAEFPTDRNIALTTARAIDDFVLFLTVQYGPFFDAITAVMRSILNALKFLFTQTPWPVTSLLMLLAAWRTGGIRVLLFTFAAILYIGLFGFWEGAMDTLSLVAGSVLVCVIVGIPIGVWSAKSDRVNTIISPVMDLMQTMPSFVYLIPAIAFFSIGRVPAVLATVVFAMPPMIRLTALGIRQVPDNVKESALAFGATPLQILLKVDLPLSMPSLMAGLNQTIMMSLSMVVIAALIGAGGLGFQVLFALQQVDAGKGLLSGVAIVICAMVIDKMVQGNPDRKRRKSSGTEKQSD